MVSYSEEGFCDIPFSQQKFKGFKQGVNHLANPLHIYCWLIEELYLLPEERKKKVALSLSQFYEEKFFKTFFNNGHGKSRVSKLLKTLSDYFPYAKD